MRHWRGLPKEVVDVPFPAGVQGQAVGALSNLILLSVVRYLNSIVLKMPSNPNNFMIL